MGIRWGMNNNDMREREGGIGCAGAGKVDHLFVGSGQGVLSLVGLSHS
jgi:hypothetical protein